MESRREWMLTVFSKAASKHKRNKNYQFWAHDNHPKELLSDWFTSQKLNYIHMNPVKAGLVESPEDYIYWSARNYNGKIGLLNIEILL